MFERGHHTGFLLEALRERLVVEELRRQHFERHDAIERRFVRPIHRGHPALAEYRFNSEGTKRGSGFESRRVVPALRRVSAARIVTGV